MTALAWTLADLAWLGGFAAACLGLGWPVVSRFDRGGALTAVERSGGAFLLGGAVFSFATWAVGSVVFTPAAMWVLAAVLAVPALPGLRAAWRALRPAAPLGRVEMALLAVAVALCLNLVLNALAPPADYDSLNYHLSFVRRDLELGTIQVRRDIEFAFFPNHLENLFRLALATLDDRVAQGVHALYGVAAALGAGALAVRMGGGRAVAMVAVALFAAIRVVVWEAGSCQVELGLAAHFTWALLAFEAGARRRDGGLLALSGLMLGLCVATKYLGMPLVVALGLVVAVEFGRRRIAPSVLAVAVTLGLAVVAPLLLRNWLLTHNPVYPLFHPVFVPDALAAFDGAGEAWGRERSLLNLLRAPWDVFILPSHYFDGQVFGFPYILALAPPALVLTGAVRATWRSVAAALVYYVLWYYVLSQQVRFLIPLFPLLAAFAAVGAGVVARQCAGRRWVLVLALSLAAVAIANQALFLGVYGLMRYPAGLRLQSVSAYLATPTITGSHYEACRFVADRLGPGQHFIMATEIHSYYCPQASMINDWWPHEAAVASTLVPQPDPTPAEILAGFDRYQVAFVMVTTAFEDRSGVAGTVRHLPASLEKRRLLAPVQQVLDGLVPVFTSERLNVYSGADIRARIAARLGEH